MSDAAAAPAPADAPTPRRRILKIPDLGPGLVTRLKFASYLFVGLFMCLLLRGAMSKMVSDIPYLQHGCHLTDPASPSAGSNYAHHASVLEASPSVQDAIASYRQLVQITKKLSHTCFENVTVYRISFALALFFLLQLISVSDFTCCIDDESRAELQGTFFTGKTILLLMINVGVFFIPNDFYVVYAYICVFVSAIFLLVQIALIVDFSYVWNEEWGKRSDDNSKWGWYLICTTVVMYGVGIYLTVYNYMTFVPHENCNLHGFVVTGCLMSAVVYTAIAVWVPHGSVLPSGMIFAYSTFLVTSALRMSTDQRCNAAFVPAGSETLGMMLSYAVIAAGTLGYSVVSMSGKYKVWASGATDDEETGSAAEEEGTGHSHESTSAVGHLPAYCYFHGIMLMGAMYLAMLGTDWQVSGTFNAQTDSAQLAQDGGSQTPLSFWVKLASQWVTIAVYLWSLLAPYYCCRHRDFGYDLTGWDNA